MTAMSESDDRVKPFENNEPYETTGQGEMEFAGTLKRLESIVKSLESGELSLEESLKTFEEGIKLARYLESILDRAERKVEEILNPEKASGSKGDEGDSGI
jgi:exodeoxyribonuclease VII small subunit